MLWQSSFVRHVTFDNLKSVYHFRHLLLCHCSPPSHIFCCIIYFWWHIKCGWCSVPADVTNDAWLSRRKLSPTSHVAKCGLSCPVLSCPLLCCPVLLLSYNNYWQVTTKCWNNSFRAASCSHERTGCKYWTCMKKLRWVDIYSLLLKIHFTFFKAAKQTYFIFLFG